MSCVTVRFHRGSGWGSALVRSFTRSPIGHVDLLVPGYGVLDVRPSVGARWAQVDKVPDMGLLHEIDLDTSGRVVALHLAAESLENELPAPYDWSGAIAAGVPLLAREHATAFFCSEAVGTLLHRAGLIRWSEPWRLQPVSLLSLCQFHQEIT
jgi:hypothetical protein